MEIVYIEMSVGRHLVANLNQDIIIAAQQAPQNWRQQLQDFFSRTTTTVGRLRSPREHLRIEARLTGRVEEVAARHAFTEEL